MVGWLKIPESARKMRRLNNGEFHIFVGNIQNIDCNYATV